MVDISNVVNISVAKPNAGLGTYNVNAVLYLTTNEPLESFAPDSYRIYRDSVSVGKDFGTDSVTYQDAVALFGQKPNVLAGDGYLIIAPLEEDETLTAAINRIKPLVYFGGWFSNKEAEADEIIAAAKANETLEAIYVVGSGDSADFTASTGLFDKLAKAGLSRTKALYYGDSSGDKAALRGFVAAYVGRAFSVNFSAQNATITMNLKDLTGVNPDTTVTETIYTKAADLGVDMYVAYSGLPKVVSNGNPEFFDDVYNRLWFELRMKVEIFNVLAKTATKIPQTETGMNKVKSAARAVCQMGVYNGFLAAGTWNGTDTFGDQDDFYRNIEDFGYYVYSLPVTEQSQTEREQRVAPVIQVACKQAGAIHKINLIINFEA